MINSITSAWGNNHLAKTVNLPVLRSFPHMLVSRLLRSGLVPSAEKVPCRGVALRQTDVEERSFA